MIEVGTIPKFNMIRKPKTDIVLDGGKTVHPQDQLVQNASYGDPNNGRNPTERNKEELLVEITKDRGCLPAEIQTNIGYHKDWRLARSAIST